MKRVLTSDTIDPSWSKRARSSLETARAEHGFLRDGRELLDQKDTVEWWTFAGGAANTLLARMLERELGGRVVARNTHLTLADDAGRSLAAVRACLDRFHREGRPNVDDTHALAGSLAARTQLSKFEVCLPDEQLAELQVARLFDLERVRAAVAGLFGSP